MRIIGLGCLGCGGVLAILGVATVVAAFFVADQNTFLGAGGSLCFLAVLPVIIGMVLMMLDRPEEPPPR